MCQHLRFPTTNVNRHTGGLEMLHLNKPANLMVNRHTGGLEINSAEEDVLVWVNRHTGGLEK